MDPSRIDRRSRILGADIATLLRLMLDRNKVGYADAIVSLGKRNPGLRQHVADAAWRFFHDAVPGVTDHDDVASVISLVVALRTLSGKEAIQAWRNRYQITLLEERFVPLLAMIEAALSRPMKR